MDIRVLGPVELYSGAGQRVDLGPRQQRFLLAVLALEVNHLVPVSRLIDLIWSDRVPRTATHAVQVSVSRLRAILSTVDDGARIETRGPGYVLIADRSQIDAARFLARREQAAEEPDDERRVALYTEALDLWSGPALTGTAPPEVAARLGHGLEEARLSTLEDRLDAQLRLGRHRAVRAELSTLTVAHPDRERLLGQLMLALYRSGQAPEALLAYRQARDRLAEESGLDPGAELARLELAILRADPALDHPAPGLDRAPPTPRELPPDVYAFTGRHRELGELDQLSTVDAHGPVIAVLCGTGGVGKTALCVRWAHRVADRFPDGQLYLDLRGSHANQPVSPYRALGALLTSLGVSHRDLPTDLAGRSARYRSLLAGRRLLVVLDNALGAEQVRPLLPGTATCQVLVTSRDDLAGLVVRDGARRIALDVLPDGEAVQLLRTLVGPRAEQEPDHLGALARQCARLPLALRIAADLASARGGTPLGDLVSELADEQRRLDRLDAVIDDSTTIRAVFSWSERHLSAPATRLFWLLGLHPGRSLAVPAVAALSTVEVPDARRLIDGLRRAHLVEPVGPDRYAMHDLLRAYAAARAVGQLSTVDRVAALTGLYEHYLVEVARGEREWLDAERSNLVAAAGAASGELGHYAGRLARALAGYLEMGYHNADAFAVYQHALRVARQRSDPDDEALARYELGRACARSGRYIEALTQYRHARHEYRRLSDQPGQARCHNAMGNTELQLGRYPEALLQYRRALVLHRRTGDRPGEARALSNIGRVHWCRGQCREALRQFEPARELYEALDDRIGQGRILNDLGNCLQRLGRLTEAYDCHAEALKVLREVGDSAAEACALTDLGRVHSAWGQPEAALEHHTEALSSFRRIGDRVGEAEVLLDLGLAHERAGEPEPALTRYREGAAIAVELNNPALRAVALNGQGRALRSLRPAESLVLHEAALAQAIGIGDRDSQARALAGLAAAYAALGQATPAQRYRSEAMALFTELGLPEAEPLRR